MIFLTPLKFLPRRKSAKINKNLIVLFLMLSSIFSISHCYAVTVGDFYGGGTVFCVSDTADTTQCRTEGSGDYGLIMANEDQVNFDSNSKHGVTWATAYKTISGAQSLDNGAANTAAIIAAHPQDNPNNNAAWLSHNYKDPIEGHTDWYLPSKNELNKMYLYAKAHNLIGKGCSGSKTNGVQCLVGGYDERMFYWSCSEYSGGNGGAWGQSFRHGGQDGSGKINDCLGVRAIRAFNNLTIKPFNNLSLNSNQKQAAEKEEENYNRRDKRDSFDSSLSGKISEAFICPITQETMVDPVIAADGHTYERTAIEEWFGTGKRTSPMTNLLLENTTLTPNIALRQTIRASNDSIIEQLNNLSLNSNQQQSIEKEENDNKRDSLDSSSSRMISAVNKERCVDVWDAIDLANHNPQELERLIKEHQITDLNKLRNGAIPIGFAAGMNEVDVIRLLLNHGAYINLQNANEQTALMQASFSGHIGAVRLLIKHGAKVNLRGGQGETALMLAVESGSIDIVRLLVDNGANVNLRDDRAHTALMLAVKSGNIDLVRVLVDQGSNVNMRDDEGNTVLQLAETLTQRFIKIVDLLRDAMAKTKS